jgi:hypothetical protein
MVKRTLCVLALIGVTSVIGYSQETGSEYVSPSEAVPRGRARKMQVQLLNPGEATKQYAVIFYQGDEAFSGLLDFAQKYQVTSARFTAIGHWMEQHWGGSIPNAKCTRRFRSSVSTK